MDDVVAVFVFPIVDGLLFLLFYTSLSASVGKRSREIEELCRLSISPSLIQVSGHTAGNERETDLSGLTVKDNEADEH